MRDFRPVQPILFELPLPGGASLPFPAYGTMMVVGMLLANLAGAPRAMAIGLRPGQVFDFGLFAVAGGVLGAHWLHVALYPGAYFNDGLLSGLKRAFIPWQGGLVYYGGLAGAMAVILLYARLKRIPSLDLLDYVAPIGALGLASTRVGCFLNGCCWGEPTNLAWGVTYPRGSMAQASHLKLGLVGSASPALPVHPVQLYEVGAALAIFALLYAAYPKRRYAGQITAWFGVLYTSWRLVIETFRADAVNWQPGLPWWHVNVYQGLSLALLGVAIGGLWWLEKRRRVVEPAAP